MLLAEASSAICVQRFDGSRNSAIHTTYRISLRSSSLREPRYPSLRVVLVVKSRHRDCVLTSSLLQFNKVWGVLIGVKDDQPAHTRTHTHTDVMSEYACTHRYDRPAAHNG
jgi:hypothetical protein